MLKRSKKTKLIALAFAFIVSASAVTATSASAYSLIGDVDGDGKVDAIDASQVLSYYAAVSCGQGAYICTDVADVDGDGKVDAIDASSILSYYADLSVGKDAVWSKRSHNHDRITLKPQYRWTVKEWPDYSSETTAYIDEESQVYVIDKDVFSDWYQVEFDDKAVGYINVTDGELAEYFVYEKYSEKAPEVTTTTATTTIATTTTTEVQTSTTSTTSTSSTTTTTSVETTSSTTTTTVSAPVTTTASDSSKQKDKTHMCKLTVKSGYTWAVKVDKDFDSEIALMATDKDEILTISKSGNWYRVLVNEDVTAYMYITDSEMDKYFDVVVLGPVAD